MVQLDRNQSQLVAAQPAPGHTWDCVGNSNGGGADAAVHVPAGCPAGVGGTAPDQVHTTPSAGQRLRCCSSQGAAQPARKAAGLLTPVIQCRQCTRADDCYVCKSAICAQFDIAPSCCLQVLGYEGLIGTVGVAAVGIPLTMLLPGSDAGTAPSL